MMAEAAARLDVSGLRAASPEVLHLLPCVIQRLGPAKVSEFFEPAVRDGPAGKEVSFRGKSLRGQEVAIPEGYMGIVLKEDQKPRSEDEEERRLTVRSTFRSFTQWNLETPPSADDVLVMSMAWPEFASAVHAPVD